MTDRIPYPDDQYDPWQPPESMDAFQEALVLSAYPAGSEITGMHSYRPGYMHYPLRVSLQTPVGDSRLCVLKADRFIGGIEREGSLLPVLEKLGLAVPHVLAGPIKHPQYPTAGPFLVISELPGQPLPWLEATLAEVDQTCHKLFDAIDAIRDLTVPLRKDKTLSQVLPANTLRKELNDIMDRGGPWINDSRFMQAVAKLRPTVDEIDTPLVFSNGDYNPINFLWDGHEVTGWLDFALACFEDPHIGFAKFVIFAFDTYGWGAGARSGLVERYLYRQNVSRAEFAPRLALRCLYRLQRDTSVTGRHDAVYREAILDVLEQALASW